MSIPTNPFSARHLRPATLPFVFEEGQSLDQLVQTLWSQRGWGQIVGPHGSGKSTLIRQLIDRLADTVPIRYARITSQRRSLPAPLSSWLRSPPGTQYVIDGLEQLPAWQRGLLGMSLRRSRCGLLVTTHRDLGWEVLFQTRVTMNIARQVANQLLAAEASVHEVPYGLLRRLLDQHDGNLREVLFSLYDWYPTANASKALSAQP